MYTLDRLVRPWGEVHLASSADCVNQAFRWGNAWVLQFDVEVTVDIVAKWAAGHGPGR